MPSALSSSISVHNCHRDLKSKAANNASAAGSLEHTHPGMNIGAMHASTTAPGQACKLTLKVNSTAPRTLTPYLAVTTIRCQGHACGTLGHHAFPLDTLML